MYTGNAIWRSKRTRNQRICIYVCNGCVCVCRASDYRQWSVFVLDRDSITVSDRTVCCGLVWPLCSPYLYRYLTALDVQQGNESQVYLCIYIGYMQRTQEVLLRTLYISFICGVPIPVIVKQCCSAQRVFSLWKYVWRENGARISTGWPSHLEWDIMLIEVNKKRSIPLIAQGVIILRGWMSAVWQKLW